MTSARPLRRSRPTSRRASITSTSPQRWRSIAFAETGSPRRIGSTRYFGAVRDATNESAPFELDDHAMNGWWRDSEVPLHVGSGWRGSVEQDAGVNEGQALLLREPRLRGDHRQELPRGGERIGRRDDRAKNVAVGTSTVYRTKRRFVEEGLEAALSDERRPGAERKLAAKEEPPSSRQRVRRRPRGERVGPSHCWRARWCVGRNTARSLHRRFVADSLKMSITGRRLRRQLKSWQKTMCCIPKVDADSWRAWRMCSSCMRGAGRAAAGCLLRRDSAAVDRRVACAGHRDGS